MRAQVIQRLKAYWRLEAANAAFVPGLAAWLVLQAGDRISWPLALAMIACALLLLVGAAAWRMELRELQGDPRFGRAVLPWLSRLQAPTGALALVSLAAAGIEVWRDGGWSASAIATAALSALALLEYVNYYVVQLQHFDHAADFARLLRGRGFREAHLARAVRRWRRRA
jgi:hypothetical protein